MRLDFIHSKLIGSDIDLIGSKPPATCARSSHKLKKAVELAGGCTSKTIFNQGVVDYEVASDLIANGFSIVAEPFEIDTFFINQTDGLDLIRSSEDTAVEPTVRSDELMDLMGLYKIDKFLQSDSKTLANTLLIRLPNIKARSLVNALKIDGIYITNSEACSLTLGTPSLVLQSYGFSEEDSREAMSLSWAPETSKEELFGAVKKMIFRYNQLRKIV